MHNVLFGVYYDICTCHGPKIVRIQMLLKSFFGGLWDLRAQNAAGRANGDIIPAKKTQEVMVIELLSEKDFGDVEMKIWKEKKALGKIGN